MIYEGVPVPPSFPFGKKSEDEKPVNEPIDDRPLTEEEEVRARRCLGLLDLGLSLEDAMMLSVRPDIVHDAERLAKKGCPPNLITVILL